MYDLSLTVKDADKEKCDQWKEKSSHERTRSKLSTVQKQTYWNLISKISDSGGIIPKLLPTQMIEAQKQSKGLREVYSVADSLLTWEQVKIQHLLKTWWRICWGTRKMETLYLQSSFRYCITSSCKNMLLVLWRSRSWSICSHWFGYGKSWRKTIYSSCSWRTKVAGDFVTADWML